MSNAENIETTLRAQLPAALHTCVPLLAAVIADLQAGRLTLAEAAEQLRAEVFTPLQAQLAGQALLVDAVRLEVAPGGDTFTFGNLTNVEGVAASGATAQVAEGSNIALSRDSLSHCKYSQKTAHQN